MTSQDNSSVIQGTAVAIDGRAVLMLGKPGSGKSSLALALIDRGAQLIGDDGVTLNADANKVIASPPPNIAGKLEVRNIGLVEMPTTSAPLCLVLELVEEAPRFAEEALAREILGLAIPAITFRPGDAVQAIRAEMALKVYGLPNANK